MHACMHTLCMHACMHTQRAHGQTSYTALYAIKLCMTSAATVDTDIGVPPSWGSMLSIAGHTQIGSIYHFQLSAVPSLGELTDQPPGSRAW